MNWEWVTIMKPVYPYIKWKKGFLNTRHIVFIMSPWEIGNNKYVFGFSCADSDDTNQSEAYSKEEVEVEYHKFLTLVGAADFT